MEVQAPRARTRRPAVTEIHYDGLLCLHELCHIQEHNHTERFWALVRRVDYDYQRKEEWLRTNGAVYSL